jgi:phosphoglycolate phosphatase
MPLAAILFDKDGTLIDFDGTWGPTTHAVIHALAKGDLAAVHRQAKVLHFSIEQKRFLPTSPLIAGSSASYGALWADALARTDVVELKREIDALTAIESLKALTPIGVPSDVLGALKAMGLRLGIATNDSEASARRQATALSLSDHLDFIVGYDSGHGGKPEPGMILAFAKYLGVAPSEIAMVGDSEHDMSAARAAGAVAIGVLSGPADRETLAPVADHILDDIHQLPALIKRLR